VPYDGKPLKKIAILPSGVQLTKHQSDTPAPNQYRGKILSIRSKPPLVLVDIHVEGLCLTAELLQHDWQRSGLAVSDVVHFRIPLQWIRTQVA
jgi:hypothetical protein